MLFPVKHINFINPYRSLPEKNFSIHYAKCVLIRLHLTLQFFMIIKLQIECHDRMIVEMRIG